MKKVQVYHIDSFTTEKFKGNPAGVVLDSGGLTEEEMFLIARELNHREIAFLNNNPTKECDATIRYLTPTGEVPLCGHATIAAMYAKAIHENLDPCIIRTKTKVGILPFEITKDDSGYEVVMTQGKVEIGDPLEGETLTNLCNALGVSGSEVNNTCPVQVSSTGNPLIMFGINTRLKLNSLDVDMDKLEAICKAIGCNGCFVFTFDSNVPDILTFGRMFAPIIHRKEDIVTGTAHGALGAYLVQNNLVKFDSDCLEFKGMQGEVMNRAGVVTVIVELEDGKPKTAKIKGKAAFVYKTEIELDN